MLSDFPSQENLLFLFAEGQGAQFGHPVVAHHAAGQFGSLFDVVARARGHVFQKHLLGHPSTHHDGDLALQEDPGVGVLVILRELHGHPQGHPPRNNGHLVERVGLGERGRHQGVTGFVIGRVPLFGVADDHGLSLHTHQDLVLGAFEIQHGHGLLVVACGVERGFVDQIGQIGPGKAGGAACQNRDVHILRQGNFLGVDLENAFPSLHVGPSHHHPTVEPSGSQQGRVQHVGAVGGRNEDHALVGLESVHLDQQLIQGLLALVVPPAQAGAAVTPDSVDLIDEDDAGGVLLALLEQVSHSGGPHAHEHLHEVGSADGEEGHPGLAGDGSGQKRLARAWRSDQQHPFGDSASQFLKLLGVLQEFDDFLQFFLGFLGAGHVLEGDFLLLGGQQLGTALSK